VEQRSWFHIGEPVLVENWSEREPLDSRARDRGCGNDLAFCETLPLVSVSALALMTFKKSELYPPSGNRAMSCAAG
jgi:hypothetical protein